MKLEISFLPYEEFSRIGIDRAIEIILDKTRQNNLVIIEGGLTSEEEMNLIEKTMEKVNYRYKGIELCSLSRSQLINNDNLWNRFVNLFLNLLGRRSGGITLVGPAKIIKEIKRHPDKISLLIK